MLLPLLLIVIAAALLWGGIAVRNAIGMMLVFIASLTALVAVVLVLNRVFGGDTGLYAIFTAFGALAIYGFCEPTKRDIKARIAAERERQDYGLSPWPKAPPPSPIERTTPLRPRR